MKVVNLKSLVFLLLILASAVRAELIGPPLVKENYSWMSPTKMKSLMKKAKSRAQLRKVAGEANEMQMSEQFRTFRDTYLKTKNPETLDKLLSDLDKKFDSYPSDLQFIAARLIPARKLRGIVYRLKPVVKKQRITHSFLLTVVQRLATRMNVFFPSDHASTTFRYITEPYLLENGNVVKPFETMTEFQSYLASAVYPAVLKSASRVESIDLKSNPVLWDNKIVSGSDSFVDGVSRFRVIGEAERYASLSRIHSGLQFMSRFFAYNIQNILSYTKDMGQLNGVDGFGIFNAVDGSTSYKRVKIAKKKEYKNLYAINNQGKKWMARSFLHLKESVKNMRLVWEELQDRPASQAQLINPARFNAFGPGINASIKIVSAMLEGKTEVRSSITGEVITVDIPAVYANPISDLKLLLPIAWDTKDKKLTTTWKTKKGKHIKYRNYFWGSATKWSKNHYKTMFPSLKSGKDVQDHMRVFRSVWGTSGSNFIGSTLN